jgi:hypothetical protein
MRTNDCLEAAYEQSVQAGLAAMLVQGPFSPTAYTGCPAGPAANALDGDPTGGYGAAVP